MAADIENIDNSSRQEESQLSLEDQSLVERFRGGSLDAFEYIYNRHVEMLHRYGQVLTDDIKVVEDAIQDLFVSLWSYRQKLDIRFSIKYYLIKAFRRLLIGKLTDSRIRHIRMIDYSKLMEGTDSEGEWKQELIANVEEAARSLPTQQYEVVVLKYVHGYSYDKIAETLEITRESAYNLSSRALASLKRACGN